MSVRDRETGIPIANVRFIKLCDQNDWLEENYGVLSLVSFFGNLPCQVLIIHRVPTKRSRLFI